MFIEFKFIRAIFGRLTELFVFAERLGLPVRRVKPLLEVLFADFGDVAQAFPALCIVRKIGGLCLFDRVEAIHYLVFVKLLCFRVDLVYHVNLSLNWVIRQEDVDMIAVNGLRASDIAIIVSHYGFPFLAVPVSTSADTAFRILNGYVESVNLQMSLAVVSCLFLCFGRIRLNLGSCFFDFCLNSGRFHSGKLFVARQIAHYFKLSRCFCRRYMAKA